MLDCIVKNQKAYKDVHKSSMKEDGSKKSPQFRSVPQSIRIISSEVFQDDLFWPQKVVRIHSIAFDPSGNQGSDVY